LSTKDFAGTYEVEVLLGSQEVCFLDADLPESKSELQKVNVNTPFGEEYFRGLVASAFSSPGESRSARKVQIYDLMEAVSNLREGLEANENAEALRARAKSVLQDELAEYAFGYFLVFSELLGANNTYRLLSQLSKFLLTQKESLPKVSQVRQTREAPRWDRVVKQNLIGEEVGAETEVNPLEDETIEADTIDGEWTESSTGSEPVIDRVEEDIEEPDELSDIP
jgi:hypothetical protein